MDRKTTTADRENGHSVTVQQALTTNTPSCDCLEYRRASPDTEAALAVFFDSLRTYGDDTWFHPHPLTNEEARRICSSKGRDLYLVGVYGQDVVAYGLLRGWDEGYEIPSLGIALHPDVRGKGLARSFMLYLHATARLHGASTIRLKVYNDNVRARCLYEKLGYRFTQAEDSQLLGLLDIS